jgi:thymidylate synthase
MEEKKNFINKIKDLPADDEFVLKWWDLGPVYGHQWRNFNSQWVDQIKNAIEQIKINPTNRRIIVSAWNPAQIDQMLLPPCHAFFQFNVDTTNNKLNLQLYQRSADMFLWVPFNIASYSTLLMLIANITWLEYGSFTHTLWDAHIYNNHVDQVNEQLSREPLPLPEFNIKKDIKTLEDIEALEWEDFELLNYQSHWVIKAPVAV